jgi:hypothetical protein
MLLEQIPDHIEQQLPRKQQLEEEIKALQARELEFRTVRDFSWFCHGSRNSSSWSHRFLLIPVVMFSWYQPNPNTPNIPAKKARLAKQVPTIW